MSFYRGDVIFEHDLINEAFANAFGVADLNQDGLDDVVLAFTRFNEFTKSKVQILLNDGRGSFVFAPDDFIVGGAPELFNPRQIIVADFNRDGTPDVFIAAHGVDFTLEGEPNALLLSDAEGRLHNRSDLLPDRSDFSHALDAADIDGDGDLDILVGNLTGRFQESYFLMNDGNGAFTPSSARLPDGVVTKSFANSGAVLFVDINGDGAPDLVHGDHSGSPGTHRSALYLNNGSGNFTDQDRIDLPVDTSMDGNPLAVEIVAFDANNDGLVDLLFSNYVLTEPPFSIVADRHLQLLINDGVGGFVDESNRIDTTLPDVNNGQWYMFLDTIDFNNDGHPDVLNQAVTTGEPVDPRTPLVFLNDGRGRFSALTAEVFDLDPAAGDSPRPIMAVDADGDGGMDFLHAGFRFALIRQLKPYGTGPEGIDPAPLGAPGFNEDFYLNENPDVAALVDQGRFATGLDHYLAVGRAEGREIMAPGTRFAGTLADDVMRATTGDEIAFGRGGDDRLIGRAGDDVLFGNGGDDVLLGQRGDDRLVGGRGSDILRGGEASDRLLGNGGPDLLIGGGGGDLLEGGGKADRVVGGGGGDRLFGGNGRDTLSGNGGDDLIHGGRGADRLSGGSGRDRFLYTRLNERGDEIADFEVGPGGDRLVLRDLFDGFVDGVSDPNDFLELIEQRGATVVRVDANGQGADGVRLLTLQGVIGTTVDGLVGDGNVVLD